MHQFDSLRRVCFSMVLVLALVNCGSAQVDTGATEAPYETTAASALTVPPAEAGIKYRGLRALIDGRYTVGVRSGDDLQMVHLTEGNFALAELAVYEFANGLDFCIPGTLRLIQEDPQKARALEIYVATCLENSGSSGVRFVENHPLSWRRLGATGPFADNRGGSFAYPGAGQRFAPITNKETRMSLTHRPVQGFNTKVTLETATDESSLYQEWALAYYVDCNIGSGRCMEFE